MKTTALALTTAALLTSYTGSAAAVDALFEDFEDANVEYTLSNSDGPIIEFSDGFGDFFTRSDGSNTGTFIEYFGQGGLSYFAGSDLDGEGTQEPFFQDFNGIDINGLSGLEFSILLAEDEDAGNEDWDATDFVLIQYQIDGGGFQNLLAIEALPGADAFNEAPAIDTDFDGVGDGAEITDTFAQFTANIGGTGSTLDIRITWDLDSGDEDLAIDDVRVTGIPEPSSLALLGLGGLLIARRRKG